VVPPLVQSVDNVPLRGSQRLSAWYLFCTVAQFRNDVVGEYFQCHELSVFLLGHQGTRVSGYWHGGSVPELSQKIAACTERPAII